MDVNILVLGNSKPVLPISSKQVTAINLYCHFQSWEHVLNMYNSYFAVGWRVVEKSAAAWCRYNKV